MKRTAYIQALRIAAKAIKDAATGNEEIARELLSISDRLNKNANRLANTIVKRS